MHILSLTVIFAGLLITHIAWTRSRKDGFYSLTHYLFPLGIYVWGDGLILGPFWVLSGLIFNYLTHINTIRYLLLFHALRSGYEVIYWLNHQAVKDTYRPPMLPFLENFGPKESAILYQLAQTVALFLSLAGLFYTFTSS